MTNKIINSESSKLDKSIGEKTDVDSSVTNKNQTQDVETTNELPTDIEPLTENLENVDNSLINDELTNINVEKKVINSNCTLNKEKDEKIKKISFYCVLPLLICSIAFSALNMGRIRYPISLLFMCFVCISSTIFNTLRYSNIKKCTCDVCKTQNKNILMSTAIWSVGAVALFIAFLVLILK